MGVFGFMAAHQWQSARHGMASVFPSNRSDDDDRRRRRERMYRTASKPYAPIVGDPVELEPEPKPVMQVKPAAPKPERVTRRGYLMFAWCATVAIITIAVLIVVLYA